MRLSPIAIALSLLAAPLSANAVVTVTVNGVDQALKFGKAECDAGTTASFRWDLGTGFSPDLHTITIRASRKSDCSANVDDKTYPAPTNTTTGAIAIALSDFTFAAGCSADVGSAAPENAYLCVSYQASTSTSAIETGKATTTYAFNPPTPPSGIVVEGGNNLLRVSWVHGSSTEKIRNTDVFVVPSGEALPANANPSAKEVSGSPGTTTVTATASGAPLVNGLSYDVYLRARDEFGNISAMTAPVAGSPVSVDDFYSHYRRLGGQAEGGGGCTSAPVGVLSLLGLLAFRRRARTRRAAGRPSRLRLRGPFLIGTGVALSLLLAAPPAMAQQFDNTVRTRRAPRRLMFSAKFDKYDPQVDSEAALNGATPYRDIFADRVPWRAQLQADFALVHFYGSWMLGFSAGYWENIGKGREVVSGLPSGDTALLQVIPLGVLATYRFDWLADQYRWFPLIPYAQIGFSSALWISRGGNGEVSDSNVPGDTGRGSGWTIGYTTALGVALSIDLLSPQIANEAYVEAGLQRTSFFVEYGWTRLDGFRNEKSLILTDKAVRFGLSLEF